MKIALMVEGRTERAFLPYLRQFLEGHVAGKMPRIDPVTYDGRLPTGEQLRIDVGRLLTAGRQAADAVVALTDVYTGTRGYVDAADAKAKMRRWVGPEERFHPHAAQYDFEAWLLPYWTTIQRLAGHNTKSPGARPEDVDHGRPPSEHVKAIFRAGGKGHYVKPRDVGRILRGQDLLVAAKTCVELKAFLNTLLRLSGGQPIA